MRIPRTIRPIVVLALSAAAAAVSGSIGDALASRGSSADPRADEWLLYCYDQRASSYDPAPSRHVDRPYELRLVRTLATRPFVDDSRGPVFLAANASDGRGTSVVAVENVGLSARDEARTIEWSSLRDPDPAPVCDGRLLGASRTGPGRELRFLCWNPRMEYEPVRAPSKLVPSDLFVLNYSREANFPQPQCLKEALHAAAHGESLHVDNLLETRAGDGALVTQTRLDPSYNPTTAALAEVRGRDVALVNFNSGYQVSEALYRELTLPRLGSRTRGFEAPRATTRSYGSFRGLLSIDVESGNILWERRLGVISAQQPALGDINGDGIKEIVLSTYSPANGISASGTTDLSCAYVLCLDADGNELWRHRICGLFLGVSVGIGDVTGDGQLEVVATCASPKNPDAGTVLVLDGDGRALATSGEVGSAGGLVLADLTGDVVDAIVTCDTHGRLVVFDGGLDVVADRVSGLHASYDRKRLLPVAASDLDGDGSTDIIALSTAWTLHEWNPKISEGRLETDTLSYLVMLDRNLGEEARCRIPGPGGWGRGPGRCACLIADLDGNGTKEVITVLEHVGADVFEIMPSRGADAAQPHLARGTSE